MHRLSAQNWQSVQAHRDRYFRLYLDVVRRGQVEGVFRADVNPKMVTLAMFGTCNWFYTWYDPGGAWSANEIGVQLAGMHLQALRPVARPVSMPSDPIMQ